MKRVVLLSRTGILAVAVFLGAGLPGHGEIVMQDEVQVMPAVEGIAVPKPEGGGVPKTETPKPDKEALGRAIFMDGDELGGTLLGLTENGLLRWTSPSVEGEIRLRPSTVREVRLKPSSRLGKATHLVQLSNGDRIPGVLKGLDGETLKMETAYAGSLEVPRRNVARISPLGGSSDAIFEGPGDKEGWKSSNGSRGWKFEKGEMIATRSAYIGRDVKLPDTSSTEFDLAWRGQLQLMVTLYTDQHDNPGGNAYVLQMNNNYAYLQRMVRNGSSRNLGQSEIQVLRGRDKARIGIRVSKSSKTIMLTVDGKPVQQWTDSGEFVGTGTGILFYSQIDGLTKISNLVVREWDGRTDVGDDSKAPESDTLQLVNKDKVSGKINGLKDGKLSFVSALATLDVPMDRITEIRMANVEIKTDEPGAKAARFSLGSVGILSGEILSWGEKGPRIKHAAFGEASVDAGVFEKIEFNLDKAAEEKPASEEMMEE